jgi:UDP-N-acetylmuramoyl-tripeptide--D-alanyl-D-alanine ligase
VHTDTRTLAAGDLFVALKGERFDRQRLPGRCAARGAAAAIAHGGLEAAGLPGLEVPTRWPRSAHWPRAGARSSSCP